MFLCMMYACYTNIIVTCTCSVVVVTCDANVTRSVRICQSIVLLLLFLVLLPLLLRLLDVLLGAGEGRLPRLAHCCVYVYTA